MTMELTSEERALADGRGGEAAAMAMRIASEMGRLLGATRMVPVASAHIDGASIMATAAFISPNGWWRAAPRSPYPLR